MVRHLSAVLQGIASLSCGQTKPGYSHSLVYVSYFGLLSDIANKHHLIHNCLLSKTYLFAFPRKRNLKFFPLAEGN